APRRASGPGGGGRGAPEGGPGVVLPGRLFVAEGPPPPVPADAVGQVTGLLARGRRGAAVKLFLREDAQVPAMVVAVMPLMPAWAKLKAAAHTLPYDLTIMDGGQQGRPLPAGRWASLTAPTLVMAGGKSPPWPQTPPRGPPPALPRAPPPTPPRPTPTPQTRTPAPLPADSSPP